MDAPSTPDVTPRKSLQRSIKRTLWALVIALVSAVVVWGLLLKTVRMQTKALSPEIPRHSRVVLYRRASSFEPGDIVAYRHDDGRAMLARVLEIDKATRKIKVDRNDSDPKTVALSDVIGRAIWHTK